MPDEQEIVIPLRPVLTNTPLNLQLEFTFATHEREQIKRLMETAYEHPEKIRGAVVIKDKVLLRTKIKELNFGKKNGEET